MCGTLCGVVRHGGRSHVECPDGTVKVAPAGYEEDVLQRVDGEELQAVRTGASCLLLSGDHMLEHMGVIGQIEEDLTKSDLNGDEDGELSPAARRAFNTTRQAEAKHNTGWHGVCQEDRRQALVMIPINFGRGLRPSFAVSKKSKGAPNGPKRTPISFADAYNGREAYKIEKITAQVTRKGMEHYIVRWEGLCDKADTTEPASHLEDDESLAKIDEFLEARRAPGVGRPSAKRPNTVSDPGSSSMRSLPQDGLTSDEGTNAQELKLLIRSPCAAPAAAANRRATVQPRKSIVWNYFSKKFRGEDSYLYSTCSLCRTTMAFCNTTNMINHLIRKHSDDLVDDAMGGKIALKAIFKKDAGGFNKPAPVAETVKLTKLPDDVKRDYDAAAVKWIVKSCMPHNITERDQYLQEFLKEEIEDLHKERLPVSLAADIWGENGISILAIMAYWITPDFELKEKLLLAKPFSQQVKGISAHFNRSSKGWRKLEAVAAQQRVKGIIYGPVAQMLTMMEATSVPTFNYAYNYLRGAYKDDWAPPAPSITPAPVAPASKRTAFNAAPVKKAKLSEVLATKMKEVEEYLKLPQVNPINDDGTDFDLLAWWKARQTIFPHLSKMARQFPAFPATSAGVERLFSATGRMHNDFKKSTSETTLEHALIVYKNRD
eukprot:jgi/Tetstr1/464739/TSEL_009486.t1